MKTPLLTFCIPTYNRSCYLAEALQRLTVSLQEVKEYYSIIISDNNSTDDTYEIVSKYKLKLNIKYIKQKENIGLVRNLFQSIEEADGEYIWIHSDDDLITSDAVTNVIDFVKSNNDIDYIFYPRQLCNIDMIPISNKTELNLSENMIFESGYQLFESCNGIMPGMMGFYSSTIIRRKLWVENDFKRKYSEWNHLENLLSIIATRRCAIMKGIGVNCRTDNYRDFPINSYIWLDSYAKVFKFAINLGYNKRICYNYIKRFLNNQQKSYFIDLIFKRRLISFRSNYESNIRVEINFKKTIWYWLSFMPSFSFFVFRFLYKSTKFIKN